MRSDIQSFISEAEEIEVTIGAMFLQKDVMQDIYIWQYYLVIANRKKSPVQIVGRRWELYDVHGIVEIVESQGISGQQPILQPNEAFEYSSHIRLFSPSGMMQGQFELLDLENKKSFIVLMPACPLDCMYQTIS